MKSAPGITQYTAEQLAAREWMHIYAQPFNHAEARIMGTRSALEGLRSAIDAALHSGMDSRCKGITSDGEGYHVIVSVRTMEALEAEPLPYTDN